jgi:hypothetical protein
VTLALDSLGACFQGLIPATLYTCSRDGVPNVALLSHVEFVDSRHVALSFQFFNKSRRNIAENPRAMVRVYDPDTMEAYRLRLRYIRSEQSGPLYDTMSARIEAIASYSGLKGVFRLLAADVYEVRSVEREGETDDEGASARVEHPHALFTMRTLQDFLDRVQRPHSLETLLDSVLESLEALFEFRHSMILLAGEKPGRLTTIASRGYRESGIGSEIGFGDGIIGMAAEARRPIRVSGLLRQMLYAQTVGDRARDRGARATRHRIPLPGLPDAESQLGIPLLAHDELLGVLCVESERPYRFHEEDKRYLEVLAGYLSLALENALLRERVDEQAHPPGRATKPPAASSLPDHRTHEVTYFLEDECILVDGEYLVRSLPARILWKVLREHEATGRREFTNRELRLDKTLSLPAFKDNLESRLILLRRRLEQRCPDIRIVPVARGRFALELRAKLRLSERS